MERQGWTGRLLRIVPHDADDLDALTAPLDPRSAPPGADVLPAFEAAAMPQTAMRRGDAVAIGIRVSARPADPAELADRAMRLAAFAVERDVEVVVLAEVDATGFERFGFRVERIAGDTPEARAACEAQIRRFWNIDLVL
jgi:hypothetical protein